ncbi:unnamed protein product [Protopolystoma xenopodis]|uniref:Uncharacterized protein n=1 Tax=Protopolystoma xenopodis TaxID=117903 RepID=A0A3S5C6N0_9PLAT|nr:unnamed protein product [Protopolystoma xenopodis]
MALQLPTPNPPLHPPSQHYSRLGRSCPLVLLLCAHLPNSASFVNPSLSLCSVLPLRPRQIDHLYVSSSIASLHRQKDLGIALPPSQSPSPSPSPPFSPSTSCPASTFHRLHELPKPWPLWATSCHGIRTSRTNLRPFPTRFPLLPSPAWPEGVTSPRPSVRLQLVEFACLIWPRLFGF